MTHNNHVPAGVRDEFPELSGLVPDVPMDFASRVLRRVGVDPGRYDTYAEAETAAGPLWVTASPTAITGAALVAAWPASAAFEAEHRRRTGRSAVATLRVAKGVLPALRSGRARQLTIELAGLTADERAVLEAVRTVPPKQLRPLAWVARESGLGPDETRFVAEVLARNPLTVLVPTHRITGDTGEPCDVGYPAGAGEALRRAEGIEPSDVAELLESGTRFLGSDTTRIFCHPTCSDARRITVAHRVPFGSAREARQAGYRECMRCRPVAA